MAKADQKANATVTGEEIEAIRLLSDEQLREIDSFAAALDLARDTFGDIDSAADVLGSGFAVVDKERLIGKQFIAVYWRFYLGRYGDTAAVFCVTRAPFAFSDSGTPMHRAIINDGGTGIYQQLTDYTASKNGRQGGLMCDAGLSTSDYEIEVVENGITVVKPARTYYLSTALAPAVNV